MATSEQRSRQVNATILRALRRLNIDVEEEEDMRYSLSDETNYCVCSYKKKSKTKRIRSKSSRGHDRRYRYNVGEINDNEYSDPYGYEDGNCSSEEEDKKPHHYRDVVTSKSSRRRKCNRKCSHKNVTVLVSSSEEDSSSERKFKMHKSAKNRKRTRRLSWARPLATSRQLEPQRKSRKIRSILKNFDDQSIRIRKNTKIYANEFHNNSKKK